MSKAGRPSGYTEEIAAEICLRIVRDDAKIREICALEHMPSKTTLFRWLETYPEFREQYARARSFQMECWEDDLLDIADESEYDAIEEDGKMKWNHEHINRAKTRIDTRKWVMGKRNGKYSEKRLLEHTGPGGRALSENGPTLNIITAGSNVSSTRTTDDSVSESGD